LAALSIFNTSTGQVIKKIPKKHQETQSLQALFTKQLGFRGSTRSLNGGYGKSLRS
jgi:hypothetical protein